MNTLKKLLNTLRFGPPMTLTAEVKYVERVGDGLRSVVRIKGLTGEGIEVDLDLSGNSLDLQRYHRGRHIAILLRTID